MEKHFDNQHVVINKELSIWEALIPVVILIVLLAVNVLFINNGEDDNTLAGSNQFILIIGTAIAVLVGILNKVKVEAILETIAENIKQTSSAVFILLMVGALSGTWFISGIIPSMIYYGSQLLHPSIFYVACLFISAIISLATGSSWSTSATVGIALIGIGKALGLPVEIVAGAVVSGAYFGDKLSPMSDTTNLASALSGATLFSHIKYMLITTIPSFTISAIIFLVLGFTYKSEVVLQQNSIELLALIEHHFTISPLLFIVPLVVIVLIIKKINPLIALFFGVLLGGIFAVIFQPNVVKSISGLHEISFISMIKGVLNAITSQVSLPIDNAHYSDLFSSKGMQGMLNTIWLILCAMAFGGAMEAIGALARITKSLLQLFHTVFGLFASTVFSCLAINITASDQYLAIVVPAKMFSEAYKKKGLAPENLSRTLEDSGTVTSVLIPWNTCGAYQSGVLGVSTFSYLPYAFFNIISPFMTLLVAAIGYKIKMKGKN